MRLGVLKLYLFTKIDPVDQYSVFKTSRAAKNETGNI